MKKQQHILFSYGCPPKQGFGSPIIVNRHLRRLSSNWEISIVAPQQSFTGINFPDFWQPIPLPMRRWWWLPYCPQISKLLEIRFWYWQLECERVLLQKRPTAIVTVLYDIYSIFAAYLAKTWQVPLSVIIHDQEEVRAKSEVEHHLIRKNWKSVLNQATKIWSVSQELGDLYKVNNPDKISTLIPIPEGSNQSFATWKDKFTASPVVAYAGNIYPSQISYIYSIASTLQKINGTFLLVTPKNRPGVVELLNAFPNIEYQEPFPRNADVISFLKNQASCILVLYPFNLSEFPWGATSFPSKLVEFSHLGLPVLILAPPDTALGSWATKHNWYSYLSRMDEEKLFQIINQLIEKEKWIQMAHQSQIVAKSEFNPNLIQAQFESEIATVR
ncbi:hypothetical protein [Microcoleus sp. D2_18a_B4]|uniref:hypothetical protein n=1 Tax=Microcoleus sp. D2_18a_B4 TaxID=3055329 RepID=UPI002FD175A6